MTGMTFRNYGHQTGGAATDVCGVRIVMGPDFHPGLLSMGKLKAFDLPIFQKSRTLIYCVQKLWD